MKKLIYVISPTLILIGFVLYEIETGDDFKIESKRPLEINEIKTDNFRISGYATKIEYKYVHRGTQDNTFYIKYTIPLNHISYFIDSINYLREYPQISTDQKIIEQGIFTKGINKKPEWFNDENGKTGIQISKSFNSILHEKYYINKNSGLVLYYGRH